MVAFIPILLVTNILILKPKLWVLFILVSCLCLRYLVVGLHFLKLCDYFYFKHPSCNTCSCWKKLNGRFKIGREYFRGLIFLFQIKMSEVKWTLIPVSIENKIEFHILRRAGTKRKLNWMVYGKAKQERGKPPFGSVSSSFSYKVKLLMHFIGWFCPREKYFMVP